MRRSAPLLLTCLLALATGLALLGVGSLVEVPAREAGSLAAPSDTVETNVALTRRFYDAVNAVLAMGDASSLDALLPSDFVDQATHPGFTPTRDGLVQHLLALRATFPTLWMMVEELQPQGDWVLARLLVEGVARGVVAGVPMVGTQANWEAIELLRIAGGRIAERLAAGDWPVLPQPLGQVPLSEPPAGAVVRLGRLTFAPGASQPRTALIGPLLVVVEHGVLTATVEGEAVLQRAAADAGAPPTPSAPPTGNIVLGEGDALVLSLGTRYALRNAGPSPAVALALELLPWSAGAPEGGQFLWSASGLPDVAAQRLADGVATDLPAGPATISLGRVSLAAGTEFAAPGASGPWLAVAEAGSLHLATSSGSATVLSAGVGTLIPPAALPTFRNAGESPLVLLLVAITPAESDRSD